MFRSVFRSGGRALVVAALMGTLAACGGVPDSLTSVGDVAPHDGVARAHRMPVQGIDVSRWQGEIDWREVARSGKRFAFIKSTEGKDHIDPKFHDNWRAAKKAGVARGAYHFMYWCSSAEAQADWFIRNVPRDPSALPPVIDAEWNSHSRTCAARIDHDLARRKIAYMIDRLTKHYGQRPIIYTDIPFHKDVLEGYLPRDDFWIRSTAAEPDTRYENRKWRFWQFTTTGRVPGIEGDVDRNAFRGGVRAWNAWLSARTGRGRGRTQKPGIQEPAIQEPELAATPTPAPVNPAQPVAGRLTPAVSALAPPAFAAPAVGLADAAVYPPAGNAAPDDISGLLRGEAVLY